MSTSWEDFLTELGGGESAARLSLDPVPREGGGGMERAAQSVPSSWMDSAAESEPEAMRARFQAMHGLEAGMERFERGLALASLPAEDPFEDPQRMTRELEPRVRAVRARLALLGYSVRDVTSHRLDAPLRREVRRFQEEAGIVQDGWVGLETWMALQALITLEPPLDLSHWLLPGDEPRPALVRALALRLRMLGFEAPATARAKALREPLARFKAVVRTLGLDGGSALTDRAALELAFDDDALLSLGHMLQTPLLVEGSEDESEAVRFIRRLVRSELWLLGYDVGALDSRTDTDVGRRLLREALVAFWRDQEHSDAELAARGGRIDEALVKALAAEHSHAEVAPELVARFVAENPQEMKDVWTHTISRDPIFFLWDGLSRGARWLGRRLTMVGDSLTTVASVLAKGVAHAKTFWWNLVRYAYQHASVVFTTLRKAMAMFVEGINPFLAGEMRVGAGNGLVACRLRLDGDLCVVVGPDAEPPRLQDLTERLTRVGLCLRVGARAMALLTRETLQLFSGGAGWIPLLTQLVDDARRWNALLEELVSLQEPPPVEIIEVSPWRKVAIVGATALVLGALAWLRFHH
ncbi:peptidoglycan-binding protein [Myxococcaceae bacterium JPH2]|nr:peptidoglycan-binding protein [Myxococcaceae bacterium JPH2]